MRILTIVLILSAARSVAAAPFELLVGVDAGRWPGSARLVSPVPGPGIAGTLFDGDRLAGTSDVGPVVTHQGVGVPLFLPNDLGTLSFTFRRASVPLGPEGKLPLLGIDFLGGPLLELDGDLNDGVRSLVPVLRDGSPQTPVRVPGTSSFIDLGFDFDAMTVEIVDFEAGGTNEGGPGIEPGIATVLFTLAGTGPDGTPTEIAPNPALDTRMGALTAHPTLDGVFRISDLDVELWYDSVESNSGTASVLGTFQHFARFDGWLVSADCASGAFPTLAGQGLGSTGWPDADTSIVGTIVNTAHGLAGGSATISSGLSGDDFTVANNGGLPLTDFGGDLGAYFDSVVVPAVPVGRRAFVYLESAAFGANNSGDPIYGDTIAYDMVLIGAADGVDAVVPGDFDGDMMVSLSDVPDFVQALLNGSTPGCGGDAADVNLDGSANGRDVQAMVDLLL